MTLSSSPLNFLTYSPVYKATVAVTVKKVASTATDAPSTSPSDTPSDAPSTNPSDTPSDAPTDTPTDAPKTLPEISEAKAVAADKIKVTFATDIPAGTEFKLAQNDSEVKVTPSVSGAEATLTKDSDFAEGTYTVTAVLGEESRTAEVAVAKHEAKEIKITSTEALLKADSGKRTALVYYDVYDNYGESMRNSVSINWTSSTGTVTDDKSKGRLEIKKQETDTTEFRYGDLIYLVGVCTKDNLAPCQGSVPVGMEQAIDTLSFGGFLNKKNTAAGLTNELPADFSKDTYVLCYKALDQQKQEMDAVADNIGSTSGAAITFTAKQQNILVDISGFKDGELYTDPKTNEQYSTVTIQPGMYADRGGEVTIMAISNRTGSQTEYVFNVGTAKRLQTLTIKGAKDKIIADGDTWKEILFEATDTDGNAVTSYDTIARSTNNLILNTTSGELFIKQENNGAAGMYWSDNTNAPKFDNNTNGSAVDGIDRIVTLTVSVVGGEGSTTSLSVSDRRRPVSVSSVKLNDDNNGAFIDGFSGSVDFFSDNVVYKDQYGDDMKGSAAKEFLKAGANGISNRYYGIKVEATNTQLGDISDVKVEEGESCSMPYAAAAPTDSQTGKKNFGSVNVKYSIVSGSSKTAVNDAVDKTMSTTYTIVPMSEVSGFAINSIDRQQLVTDFSDKANGATITGSAMATEAATGDLDILGGATVTVTTTYDSKKLTVPSDYWTAATGGAFEVTNGVITGINQGQIFWNELYDENSAKNTRIDATKKLSVDVYPTTERTGQPKDSPSINVKVSDGASVPTTFQFPWGENLTLQPVKCEMAVAHTVTVDWSQDDANDKNAYNQKTGWGAYDMIIKDQYGKDYRLGENEEVTFTVSDQVENKEEFAHMPNSFKISKNGSASVEITGAEIKDTFKVTATLGNLTATANVTVGGDAKAMVSTAEGNNTDKELCTTLGINRTN